MNSSVKENITVTASIIISKYLPAQVIPGPHKNWKLLYIEVPIALNIPSLDTYPDMPHTM